tara:strand:- start:442 stop:804 length:363 start_codon:yes stop_codon:yes gene_type:complete
MGNDKKWASNKSDQLLVENFKKFMKTGDFSSTLNEATERGSKMLMLQRLRAALGSDMEWLIADEEQMEKGYYSDDDDTEEKIKEYFFNSGTLEDLLQHIQDNFGLNAEEIKAKMSYKVPR